MMKLQTEVALPESLERPLSYGMRLVSFGSCFSQHIGLRLALEGYDVEVNPFGIQYNPLSIARGLDQLLSGQAYEADALVQYNGLWHSFDHHGSFSSASAERTLRDINAKLERARDYLLKADYLLLTWGTAFVYELAGVGRVVSNCHKMPERTFVRRRVSLSELLEVWQILLSRLFDICPKLRIIQTVSPIRHLRDGAHGSSVSKATLMLLSEELCGLFPDRVSYFPAYELLMDELRDYRFYAEDMLHPSEQTVRYIGDRFLEWAASAESKALMSHIARLRREYQHRPLAADCSEAQLRREQLLVRIRAFAGQHPDVHLSSWLDPKDL
ncbi:MAG: GSCFA domain-containing protein [Porphyromonadaceae bacterium]|nr:GSCFA domain-containing protein [Porphyromonadaceae bacterium]